MLLVVAGAITITTFVVMPNEFPASMSTTLTTSKVPLFSSTSTVTTATATTTTKKRQQV